MSKNTKENTGVSCNDNFCIEIFHEKYTTTLYIIIGYHWSFPQRNTKLVSYCHSRKVQQCNGWTYKDIWTINIYLWIYHIPLTLYYTLEYINVYTAWNCCSYSSRLRFNPVVLVRSALWWRQVLCGGSARRGPNLHPSSVTWMMPSLHSCNQDIVAPGHCCSGQLYTRHGEVCTVIWAGTLY